MADVYFRKLTVAMGIMRVTTGIRVPACIDKARATLIYPLQSVRPPPTAMKRTFNDPNALANNSTGSARA